MSQTCPVLATRNNGRNPLPPWDSASGSTEGRPTFKEVARVIFWSTWCHVWSELRVGFVLSSRACVYETSWRKGGGTLRVSTKQVPLKDVGHHCMGRGISEDLRALLSSEHMDLVVPCRYLSWDAVFIAFL